MSMASVSGELPETETAIEVGQMIMVELMIERDLRYLLVLGQLCLQLYIRAAKVASFRGLLQESRLEESRTDRD
jgi:hypothetical protein